MQNKTRLLLAAAVCASLSSPSKTSTLAFTGGLRVLPVRRVPVRVPVRMNVNVPTSTVRSSSLLSSPNDNEVYFFRAPSSSSTTQQQHVEENYNTKTLTSSATRSSGMVSAEQRELESMEVAANINDDDDNNKNNNGAKEGGLPTSVSSLSFRSSLRKSLRSSSSSRATQQRQQKAAAPMDVDGNGTGALMNRSHTAGGPNAPLMVTSYKPKAYPIDSGKDGMDMQMQMQMRAKRETLQQDGTRLVRYDFSPSLEPKQEPTPRTTKLVLASALAAAKSNGGKLAQATKQPTALAVRNYEYEYYNGYNGPGVEDATDYDGMETANSKMALATTQQQQQRALQQQKRDRQLQPKKANLVRYKSSFYDDNKHGNDYDDHNDDDNNNQSQQQQRQPQGADARNSQSHSLANDPSYSNRYTGPTDFTLAKKTGLAVNKPISLWVERDKFL